MFLVMFIPPKNLRKIIDINFLQYMCHYLCFIKQYSIINLPLTIFFKFSYINYTCVLKKVRLEYLYSKNLHYRL